MAAEILLSEDDVIAASLAHQRLLLFSRSVLGILGFLLVSMTALFCWELYEGQFDAMPLFLLALPVCVILLRRYYTVPRNARRAFRQQAAYREPMRYEWDDVQFRLFSKSSDARLDWGNIFAWHRTRGAILLYLSAYQFLMVPARIFPNAEDRDAFERLLKGKNIPLRQKRWR